MNFEMGEKDAREMFKVFKIDNEQQGVKIVNMLEVYVSLVLLGHFGVYSESD